MAATLLTGLSWLAVSALTQMDSEAAQKLRIALKIEVYDQVCLSATADREVIYNDGEPAIILPDCNYDDRRQEEVDRAFVSEQRVRLAILHELNLRVHAAIGNLDRASTILREEEVDLHADVLGGREDLIKLLLEPVDLRPLTTPDEDLGRVNSLRRSAYAISLERGTLDTSRHGQREPLLAEIARQREALVNHRDHIADLIARDDVSAREDGKVARSTLWSDVFNRDPYGDGGKLALWLRAAAGTSDVNVDLASLARHDAPAIADAVFHADAEVWHGGILDAFARHEAIVRKSVRYRSPVDDLQRWQLFGTVLLCLAGLVLVVAGPVVTATHTAREREAGTLPVLRMTGLSADDLAMAMIIGPNVLALVAGGLLLTLGAVVLAFTAGPCAVVIPLAIILVLEAITHTTAIGLGDALGHRVNALLVGALMALALIGPGLVGTVLIISGVAGAGLLLGPLPAVLTGALGLSGLPGSEQLVYAGTGDGDPVLGVTLLGYALVSQALLAGICLLSWRRRVDQAWTPLFRPHEGIALALASVGCSALTLLDLSDRANTQSFDDLNLVTFLASSFLIPVLGWLLVSSLRRPARATAVTSHVEARKAFLRFQGLLATTIGVVALAYSTVMDQSGLSHSASELMWATLTQVFLIAETGIAALLLASRRRDGKHRVFMIGAAILLLQLALAVGVYRIEVEHVAATHTPGAPFLLGMGASPYWITFMILLWGAGLGMIIAALLRERELSKGATTQLDDDDDQADGADDDGRGRWLH